jgi:predicted nucleic acid-binding protein
MTARFADTSFYVAVVSPRDALHRVAQGYLRKYDEAVVTTEYVLVEAGNWFARAKDRPVFLDLVRCILADVQTTVVRADRTLFEAGLHLYAQRPDKDWSLTDCTSFVVMEREGLTDALTADRHFEQAGFKVLLR